MKKFSSILRNLFLIFAVIVLALSIFIVVKSKQSGEEFYILGYKPFMITTGSMEPKLKVRGIVITKQVPYEEIKVGDVISFISKELGKNVCHRVVEITEEGFITKGDNNFAKDAEITSQDEYTGKMVWNTNVIANFYYFVTEGSRVLVYGMFIVVILCIIVAICAKRYLNKVSKEIEEEKEETREERFEEEKPNIEEVEKQERYEQEENSEEIYNNEQETTNEQVEERKESREEKKKRRKGKHS